MTNFVKEDFHWDGMYLMYRGDVGEFQQYYEKVREDGSRVKRDRFVARFKYGSKPWKTWVNFLVKHFSVEDYFGRYDAGESPLDIMRSKGFISPAEKKKLKAAGFAPTKLGMQMYKKAVGIL